jgi:prolyl oligopeptidase
MRKYVLIVIILLTYLPLVKSQVEDPYLWLEEVDSKESMDFVTKQNKATLDVLSQQKEYQNIYNKSLEIYNSTDRIVYPSMKGEYIYNFWQDKEHERGIWRRTLRGNYLSGDPKWEILLDIDAMAKKDDIKWVYKGAEGLYPDYDRFLVSLSKGGGDAVITREFDVDTKSFIDGGFFVDEAKGGVSYLDENTLIVASDFGEGTMTTSGYPRQVKIWTRGTQLKDAKLIYEGKADDVGTWGGMMRDGDKKYTIITRAMTFYTTEMNVWLDNKIIKLDLPQDCSISGILNDQLIVSLKSDWVLGPITFNQGDLVSIALTDLLKGNKHVQLVYRPDEFSSVSGITNTQNKLILTLTTNVKSEMYIYTFANDSWTKEKVSAPDFGTIYTVDADEFSDTYFFNFANFLTPTTLYIADAGKNTVKSFKSLPAYFDASKYKVEQFKAKSTDGTMVPYFVVSSNTLVKNGNNPTLLYAYGGFESSSQPFYSGTIGNAWLENGGTYVLANIRGGGEFGPKWHQAGLKEKRQNVYDDFHSVAEDLIAKKITSPQHLGIMGGSNGGLLVGVAFTQRPDLYNAVVCQVPLLDMYRYNKLLAGASWMGEYGNPDIPEEWEYIKKYSPYQNVKPDMKYPEVFFTTSTRDDRVHPGHARKMVAKMNAMGYKVYYYENIEGGHAGSSTNEQRAKSAALEYSYLLMKLKD